MPVNAVPTLSTFGYVTNVAEKVDFLLAHFVEADKLQSTIYPDHVASLQWLLEENMGSMTSTVSAVQTAVQNYMNRYFDSSSVECTYEEENAEKSSSRILLTLSITVVQNGNEYHADKLMRVVEGRFKEFVKINNEVS